MRKLGIISLLGAFVASSIMMFAASAWAIPAFARKYNVECNLCHTLPPRLTKAGVAFKENAYEMPSGIPQFERTSNVVLSEQEPKAEVLPSLPYSLRLTLTGTLSRSYNPAPPVAASAGAQIGPQLALPAAVGAQAGGNIGGFGFWMNGIATLTEWHVDYKFADLFKVKYGNFQPASVINYGLGFSPINMGRNPLSSQVTGVTTLNFGNVLAGYTGVELHGTTDAANGLGFNYAAGYQLPSAAPTAAINGTNAATATYGGVGYLAEPINTWFAVSYLNINNDGNIAGATSNTLLPSVTWNVGNNFQIIGAYVSTNSTSNLGVATSTSGWSIQPEYNMERWWIGARYGTFSRTAAGVPAAASPSHYAIGVGYRFLQNVIGSINYTSFANQGYLVPTTAGPFPTNAGNLNTAGADVNTVTATFDFII